MRANNRSIVSPCSSLVAVTCSVNSKTAALCGLLTVAELQTESGGLSFCVLVTISPRRALLGGLSRGMRSVDTPPAGPRRWRPAGVVRRARGRSPIGHCHMLTTNHLGPMTPHG
jgi:hypothetical protein